MEHIDATKIPELSMNLGPMKSSWKKKNVKVLNWPLEVLRSIVFVTSSYVDIG
jgi:hypothetical protein